jgi:hypothetical protein
VVERIESSLETPLDTFENPPAAMSRVGFDFEVVREEKQVLPLRGRMTPLEGS